MFSKTLPVALILLSTLAGCFPSQGAESACVEANDATPLYELDANPLVSPAPAVGAATSVFVTLTTQPAQACRWSHGGADWFTGESEPSGCHCETQAQATSFDLAAASCPDGSCTVLYVGAWVEIQGTGQREVRFVPKASAYELRLDAVPDDDPSVEVSYVHVGHAVE